MIPILFADYYNTKPMQCTANLCVLTTTMRVSADAYAHLTSYASAGSALLCVQQNIAHFTMMCPPFHLQFLPSDFKSFNEPYNICGLSVTLKPT